MALTQHTRRNARTATVLLCPILELLIADVFDAASALELVRHWAPARVSSPLFESHGAFDPRTGDLYFVRSSKEFRGWHILHSRCTVDGWSKPAAPEFAGAALEADPYFTKNGSLYFISTRLTGSLQSKDLDIWHIRRGASGEFSPPERLPEPVNSSSTEWFPRAAADGWLYFGSNRSGEHCQVGQEKVVLMGSGAM